LLLLEDLADDLLLAVPVGEPFDGRARGAQDVAALEALVAGVFEFLLEDGLGVLVIDRDPDALGDGAQVRARPRLRAFEERALGLREGRGGEKQEQDRKAFHAGLRACLRKRVGALQFTPRAANTFLYSLMFLFALASTIDRSGRARA